MHFRIAKTFTDRLARLTGREQTAVKTAAFDLQLDPARPGLQFHRVAASKDANFWTVRVNNDLRIVVHKTGESLLLCYVDHHDEAYAWAARRRIETHPTTGAAQIVELPQVAAPEAPQDVPQDSRPDAPPDSSPPASDGLAPDPAPVPFRAPAPSPILMLRDNEDGPYQPALFAHLSEATLLSVGVPADWVPAVQEVTRREVGTLIDHLPEEAAEVLFDHAAGGELRQPATPPAPAPCAPTFTPTTPAPATQGPTTSEPAVPAADAGDPFAHPDAQRRFRVVENAEALRLALDYPWEKWTVFLHPAQQAVADRLYNGPARVSGSAGTGKTVVALHRAVRLARASANARVLLATFSKPLAQALRIKLGRLIDPEGAVARRITIGYVDGIGHQLHEDIFGQKPNIASRAQIEAALRQSADALGETRFSEQFLFNEWRHVVDAWQLRDWESYRDVSRLGRKTRIGGKQREGLWAVFERTQAQLRVRNVVTWAEAVAAVTAHYRGRAAKPFDHAVIDEAQDISIPQLRFLRALVASGDDDLFFAGDLGQRIFQQPFSWLSQGVDIRGRATSLTVNYRTSHQIRRKADKLLPMKVRDVDGYEESRKGVVSVFDGPPPEIGLFETEDDEIAYVADWLRTTVNGGVALEEIGIFVRAERQLYRAKQAVRAAGYRALTLQDRPRAAVGQVVVATMHLAKGQEFKAVAVMACDEDVLPLRDRLETAAEDTELEEIFETERHLLYVAVTRARDRVAVTGLDPGSEFIPDLLDA